MRNLTSTFSDFWSYDAASAAGSSCQITKTTVNPEDNALYVLSEKRDDSGMVELEVLKAELNGNTHSLQSISLLEVPSNTFFSTPEDASEAVSFRYLAEDSALSVLTSGGDIVLFKIAADDFGSAIDQDDVVQGYVVGSIESGIKAASWSPDDEQVVLITGEDQLVVMSRDFEVIYEAPLRTEDYGEDEMINVGWGSKQTQFHGSLGKSAAEAVATRLPAANPSDHQLPTISWRGDGSFFCVSSYDPYSASSSRPGDNRRQVRVYARSPVALSATSEPIYGLEGAISWRPSGNLIAAVQGFGWDGGAEGEGEDRGRKDVIFLERNGLQHGQFRLREDERYHGKESLVKKGQCDWNVKQLAYSSDSEILAVWIRRGDTDLVQLWTMNNYHYYLKQEILPPSTGASRFTSVAWHQENPRILYLTGKEFALQKTFEWETATARMSIPDDTGCVAVIDGEQLLMTPFRSQNVPPPMSAYQISLPSVPVHVAFAPTSDRLVVLLNDGSYKVYELHTRISRAGARGGGAIAKPEQVQEGRFDLDQADWRQVMLTATGDVCGLARNSTGQDVLISASGGLSPTSGRIGKLTFGVQGEALAVLSTGEAVLLEAAAERDVRFPEFCFEVLSSATHGLVFGMNSAGKLWVMASGKEVQREGGLEQDDQSLMSDGPAIYEPQTVATDATSMILSSTFLIYTTTSHESKYASLDILQKLATEQSLAEGERVWESRRVERGSRIVTVVPSAMSLVLQMPRGNLESINPRPLVLEVVRRDILAKRYRSAFLHCRRHRIDLNILYDVDPITFQQNISAFLDQVKEVDYLNLFISGLSVDDVTQTLYPRMSGGRASSKPDTEKVNRVCDSIRSELESRNLVKYIDTILTTHVCKTPTDLESGLRVLLQLKATNPETVQDAIKYIIFLTNVNHLYDVALGMYDFQLVLMVAQYSQKDPKEYLPFLRELRALDKDYQRFRIDDHLERWERALEHLHAGGHFDEAIDYIERHDLYIPALRLWSDRPEELKAIYVLHGEFLLEQRQYLEAAQAFVLGDRLDRAMVAYEQAHAWRQLFALAISEKVEADELSDMCERVSEYLALHARHLEAAQILLDYGGGVNEAVHVLCRGSQFAEASRLIALHGRTELIESALHPGLDDAHEQFMDTFDEMEGQLDKEMKRIKDLRSKVDQDPDSFFMIESEPALENVDVMTNATTAVTGFTRFTAAKSATSNVTGASKVTSSTRRKARRKAAGKKGTIDEFEYLLNSLGRLVARVEEKSDEVSNLLPHLLLTSSTHRELGQELQTKVDRFRERLVSDLETAWTYKSEVDLVKDELIGQEERTREAWLSAQRGQDAPAGYMAAIAAGSAQSQTGAADEVKTGVIPKPVVGEWKSRSRFL